MKVIINNVEYPYVPGSVSIDQQLNARSTASAVILHDIAIHFARGTQITIKDDVGAVLFYGFISPRENIEADMATLRTQIDAVDAHYLVDKRTITAAYSSQPAGTTVSSIISSVLASEGITAGTIEAGDTFPILDFKATKCSSALQDIAEAINFIWWVDSSRRLHFRLPGNQPAPWGLVWENVIAGSLKVSRESPEYRNRVRVRSSPNDIANDTTEQARLAAIENSSGIVEDVLEGPGYTSDSSALVAAQGVVASYAAEEIVIDFSTRKKGLEIGQTVTAWLSEHDLNGVAFLITSVSMQEEQALDVDGIVYSVTAVVGPTSMAWANRVGRLVSRGEANARIYDSIVADAVQVFTSTAVGAKPSGAKVLEYHIFGGGGGGGSGGRRVFPSDVQGGGGGAQGGYTHGVIDAAEIGDTFDVVVGAGGAGGAAISAVTTSQGNDGASGGQSSFAAKFRALGGVGGQGGQLATGSTAARAARGATAYGVSTYGVAPSSGSSTAALNVANQQHQALSCSGAGGGGVQGGSSASGGIGGTWDPALAAWINNRTHSGGAGAAQVTPLFGAQGGSGGSGSVGPGAGGTGLAGGFPSGGGGGGGGIRDDVAQPSGAGGTGGAGLVVIIAK